MSTNGKKQDEYPEKGEQDAACEPEKDAGEAETLRKELDAEKAKSEEYKALLKQVQADFENQVKRADAERRELVRSSCKDLVVKLLDVVDTMDLALKAEPKDGEGRKMMEGFKRVNAQLKAVLSCEGLAEVDASGQFNHGVHEAVETIEDPCRPEGSVAEVIQRGYTLNGRLIRTSKVVIVKNRGDANG
jgi:molecular chaperone GrpE